MSTVLSDAETRDFVCTHAILQFLSVPYDMVQNNLILMIAQENKPESQCRLRSNRVITDMIFVLRKVQEKCREQNTGLYAAFVDLTKVFDTVSQWTVENPGAPWLSPQISPHPLPAA